MRLLCDTQIILWTIYKAGKLKPRMAALISDRSNEILFSSVSLWEIALKVRRKKLAADVEEVSNSCLAIGMTSLHLKVSHFVALSQLVDVLHRDPFDHLLIAQAMAEDVPLLTADRVVQRYPIEIIKA